MDSVTQAVLGASLAGAIAGKTLGRSALITGAVLGTLPDLDVLIDYGSAVANFTQHRGFSHSLLVLLPFAVVLAWGLWRWKPQLSYQRWLTLTALILLTHPLLDAFTTYGTQLFWPIGGPIALHSLFIIDPLYTLPLIAGCLVFLIRPPAKTALVTGLVLSSLYLGWTLAAQQLITDRIQPALANAGLGEAKILVQPMPFTTILWRATVMTESQQVEIITGFLDADGPLHLEYFPRDPALAKAAVDLPEAERLTWFTGGFVRYEQVADQLTATDIRLGLPGTHPFTFVLAQQSDHGLEPVVSTRLPRAPVPAEALSALWARLTGAAPVLCLARLDTAMTGQSC